MNSDVMTDVILVMGIRMQNHKCNEVSCPPCSAAPGPPTPCNCWSLLGPQIWSRSDLLPRCMECRRGLAMRILSVCPSIRLSVCLSHAWIVTKR